ncbi:MAG TPA: amidohydrolase family protein [Oculatellaceae cyanobacterium]
MSSLVLTGGTVITPQETRFCDVFIDDGTISAVGADNDDSSLTADAFDVSDCYLTPGLIDLQLNGGPRCNFWGDPTAEEVTALSDDLLKAGVTTILPTLITDDIAHLKKNIAFLKSLGAGTSSNSHLGKNPNKGAQKPATKEPSGEDKYSGAMVRMPGIHLEGPCLSAQKPGVHPPQFIQALSKELLEQIIDDSVKLVTVAPETDATGKAVEFLIGKNIAVSLGHSNATFSEAQKAFDSGVKLVTHIYNALPAVHHRAPGAVTAALLDDSVTTAIICDGLHVAPEAVKLVLKTKSKDRVILVTDAAFIGTTGGGLVGSSITLNQAVKNVVKWGAASFAQAIQMATWNPAKAVGLQEFVGHLASGKMADIVAWDKNTLDIKHVFLGGRKVV